MDEPKTARTLMRVSGPEARPITRMKKVAQSVISGVGGCRGVCVVSVRMIPQHSLYECHSQVMEVMGSQISVLRAPGPSLNRKAWGGVCVCCRGVVEVRCMRRGRACVHNACCMGEPAVLSSAHPVQRQQHGPRPQTDRHMGYTCTHTDSHAAGTQGRTCLGWWWWGAPLAWPPPIIRRACSCGRARASLRAAPRSEEIIPVVFMMAMVSGWGA